MATFQRSGTLDPLCELLFTFSRVRVDGNTNNEQKQEKQKHSTAETERGATHSSKVSTTLSRSSNNHAASLNVNLGGSMQ